MRRLPLALAVLAVLVGCAVSSGLSPGDSAVPVFTNKTMSVEQAKSSLVTGQSSKADVLAALGPATIIKFDSGFEVWAYRSRPGRSRDEKRDKNAELVILFTPAGVVEKSRIRPATANSSY